jgi:hypothetical protein
VGYFWITALAIQNHSPACKDLILYGEEYGMNLLTNNGTFCVFCFGIRVQVSSSLLVNDEEDR